MDAAGEVNGRLGVAVIEEEGSEWSYLSIPSASIFCICIARDAIGSRVVSILRTPLMFVPKSRRIYFAKKAKKIGSKPFSNEKNVTGLILSDVLKFL